MKFTGKDGCFTFYTSINFFKRRRVKKHGKDSFFSEEGERETKVFDDDPFIMAKPALEILAENEFAYISDIIITKEQGRRFALFKTVRNSVFR